MAKVVTRGNKLHIHYTYNGVRNRKATGLDATNENIKLLEDKVIPELMQKLLVGYQKPKNFAYYFEKFVQYHKADKSFHNRIYIYNKVNAFFKDFDVDKIKRLDIKEYLDTLKMKDKTKKDYLHCIKGVLDIALDDEMIERNFATDIRFKASIKEQVEVFSSDNVEKLLKNADGILKNLLAFLFFTGTRTGEALGIMLKDIDENSISINRSISKGRITTPKTVGSIRKVPILHELREYLSNQIEISKKNNSLYLFEYNGTYIKDSTFFKRRWKDLLIKCNIEHKRMYQTRHTFITNMLNSSKFKVMDIAQIVGHSSPQMILTTYAGFIKDNSIKIDDNFKLFDTKLTQSEKLKQKY
ncbi:MAG: site-specific integrase [Campylobacterota bacterium]|nr:site-specific integrase [Campylobacterota bacterium]